MTTIEKHTKTEDLVHDIEAFLQEVLESIENEDEKPQKHVGRLID